MLPTNTPICKCEAELLGALMIDNSIADELRRIITPEHFDSPMHAKIYDEALQLIDNGVSANPMTLARLLDGIPAFRDIGGSAYLATISGLMAVLTGWRENAYIIREYAANRAAAALVHEDHRIKDSDATFYVGLVAALIILCLLVIVGTVLQP